MSSGLTTGAKGIAISRSYESEILFQSIASDVAIFENWMPWREVTVPMSWIQMKQSVLQYYFLRILSKAKESFLTGEGVDGEGRDDKGHCLALLHPPAPTQDLAHRTHRLNTCEGALIFQKT